MLIVTVSNTAARMIAAVILSAAFMVSCAAPKESGPVKITWVSFDTGVQGIGVLEKAALMIPVEVGSAQVQMQLDTGAVQTVFFRQALDLLNVPYELGQLDPNDTRGTVYAGRIERMKLGQRLYKDMPVKIWEAPDWDTAKWESGIRRAGSVGSDLFKGSVLCLDFVNDEVAIFESMPEALQENAVPISLVGGRPVFALNLESEELQVMYDTGSSAWPLIVTTPAFEKMFGPGALSHPDMEVTVPSWGEPATLYGILTEETGMTMSVGRVDLTLDSVWCSQLVDQMEKFGVDAIAGNQLFSATKVYLDFKSREMAIER